MNWFCESCKRVVVQTKYVDKRNPVRDCPHCGSKVQDVRNDWAWGEAQSAQADFEFEMELYMSDMDNV